MPRIRVFAVAVALIVVTMDLWFSMQRYPMWIRAVLGATVFILYLSITARNRGSLGIRIRPIQPVTYWIRATLIIAALLLIPILAFLLVATLMNWEFTIPQIPPDQAAFVFLQMCVIAPIVEELIYRLALCFPVAGTFGPTAAILLSGATFAGLHFVYGNPSPDNFLAGYVLAWAYLKSGSIVVPIVLHSLGNSIAFAAQLGIWGAI